MRCVRRVKLKAILHTGSYGSLARFRDVRRMQKVGQHTLIGASGDLSDYQKIMSMVQETQTYDMAHDDGCSMTPKDYHQYLGRIMYNRSPSLLKLAPILCFLAPILCFLEHWCATELTKIIFFAAGATSSTHSGTSWLWQAFATASLSWELWI